MLRVALLVLLFPVSCLAQSSWELSIEGGTAIPVGVFGNSGAQDARVYSEDLRSDGSPYISAMVTYPINDTFSLGFEAAYAASGFYYHIDPRWIPGGSGYYEYDDRLLYRAMNLGVSIICSF